MKSLFAKILLWFWAGLLITVIGNGIISAFSVNAADRRPPLARLVTFELKEARYNFETGGKPALAAFLDRTRQVFDAEGILLDHDGNDVLTGQDRSDLIEHAHKHVLYSLVRDRSVIYRSADDGKFWFFLLVPKSRVGLWFLLPEHLYVAGAAVLLCYWFAFHLTTPVRKLQRAVERFGHGDLSARAASTRKDELGELARTFDHMADRIQMLVDADRRLLLDISHELRSPLARLRVAVELARSGGDSTSALNRIEKEAERLNALVGQLLQVTRAEVDPESLRRGEVALRELVHDIVDDAAIEAQARQAEVRLFDGPDVSVNGDPELLRRAVENVVRNAIRYTPPGTTVDVKLEPAGPNAVVTVRDRGPGVPNEGLSRIFDAFYRVGTDRDRSTGGVGLGLSITKRAVELHGGQVSARNADPGLEVRIEIPGTLQKVRDNMS